MINVITKGNKSIGYNYISRIMNLHINTECPRPMLDYLLKIKGVANLFNSSRYTLNLYIGELFNSGDVVNELVKEYLNY